MIPLAEKMRPKSLEDFVGQKQLSLLYEMINNDAVSSMIFWGPPGVGKTTLAKIIAHRSQSYFVEFSAGCFFAFCGEWFDCSDWSDNRESFF